MTDLVERCAIALAKNDDRWRAIRWEHLPDIIKRMFRSDARAVIATIGAGLTSEHVEVLERVSIFLDDEDANILNRAAAVVASIVEAKG